jgi:hypothetical protein
MKRETASAAPPVSAWGSREGKEISSVPEKRTRIRWTSQGQAQRTEDFLRRALLSPRNKWRTTFSRGGKNLRHAARNEAREENDPGAERPASPHPGEHQTTVLGRSSDLPSSFLGAFPCGFHTVAFAEVVRPTAAGAVPECLRMAMDRVTGFPFHPPRGCEARHPKRGLFYAFPRSRGKLGKTGGCNSFNHTPSIHAS